VTTEQRREREFRDQINKVVAEVEADEKKSLVPGQKAYGELLKACRQKESLRRFVTELLSFSEKLEIGSDYLGKKDGARERMLALFRRKVLDDEQLMKRIGTYVESFNKALDETDAELLIALKIDRDIKARPLSRTAVDTSKFRAHLASVVEKAASAAKTDIPRTSGRFVTSMVLGSAATQMAEQSGAIPKQEDWIGNLIGSFVVGWMVDQVLDRMTDPTESIVSSLEGDMVAAEKAILDGTDANPGLFRILTKAIEERAALRRQVILDHFFSK
jgi:hypothetical protein